MELGVAAAVGACGGNKLRAALTKGSTTAVALGADADALVYAIPGAQLALVMFEQLALLADVSRKLPAGQLLTQQRPPLL